MKPPFKWVGGKGKLLPLLLPLVQALPKSVQTYVEPYCGSAALFWGLTRSFETIVLNDMDTEVAAFFAALTNKVSFKKLKQALWWTPYSRAELVSLLPTSKDPRAVFVKANQGFSGLKADSPGRWGCALKVNQALAWQRKLKQINKWRAKAKGIVVLNKDALSLLGEFDRKDAFLYLDPPYLATTRLQKQVYTHETSMAHHEALVRFLLKTKAFWALSCYDHPVYQQLASVGAVKLTAVLHCNSASRGRQSKYHQKTNSELDRVETIWTNIAVLPSKLI